LSRTDSWSVVVFDLDDTLYLERDYVRSGFRAVGRYSENIGLRNMSDQLWEMFRRGVRGNTFDVALKSLGVDDAGLVATMVSVYRQHTPEITLAPDASIYLAGLGGKLSALITDGDAVSQRAKIKALELDRLISTITLTDELGPQKSKPHPEAFELMQAGFGYDGNKFVYIADNPNKDFSAPKALGWHTIRIRRTESLHELVDSSDDVDLEISSFEQLQDA
jgi:putative hydrolase of the HAD superfamily